MKYWPLKVAKAWFSELLKAAETEPQIVTCRGKPKFEVRAFESKVSKGPKNLLQILRSAPPGFTDLELPKRTRERPRKLGL